MPTGGRQKMTDGAEKTISVPEAGRRYFDLCQGASYDAAKRGDIPTIRIGRLLRVPMTKLAPCRIRNLWDLFGPCVARLHWLQFVT